MISILWWGKRGVGFDLRGVMGGSRYYVDIGTPKMKGYEQSLCEEKCSKLRIARFFKTQHKGYTAKCKKAR